MRLKLDLDGILVSFKIFNNIPYDGECWNEHWCSVDLSISNMNGLNYHFENQTILMLGEIKTLVEHIESFLDKKYKNDFRFEFEEHFFYFLFHVVRDKLTQPNYLMAIDSNRFEEEYMEWRIIFWNGYPTDNFISIKLERENLQIFSKYLKFVLGEIKHSSKAIQNLIVNDYLTD